MKKNIILGTIVSSIVFANLTNVYASYLFMDNIKIENSNLQIKQDRSFMALRSISEMAGYPVSYDETTKTITVGDEFTHTVGTSYITKSDGEIIDIGVPSYIFEGRTYVSTRLFSEGLGFSIDYDEKTKDIYIDTKAISDEEYEEAVTETYDAEYSDDLVDTMENFSGDTLIYKEKFNIDSFKRNISGLLVDNNEALKFENSSIKKQGSTTSLDGTENYGLNAAVLVKEGSDLTANKIDIYTNSLGSPAVFVYDATAKISKSDINTFDDYSKGVVAKDSDVRLNNVNITTSAKNSDETIKNAIDFPSAKNSEPIEVLENSTMNVTNSSLTTTNNAILSLYSNATFNNVIANVTGGNIVSSVGSADFTAKNSDFNCNRTAFNLNPLGNEDIANYEINNTNINTNKYKLFNIKDIDSNITIKNSKIKNGGTLLNFDNTSDDVKKMTLDIYDSDLSGDINLSDDTSSTININSGSLTGSINNANGGGEVVVDVQPGATLYLTGETSVTAINPSTRQFGNIVSNGNRMYYDETDERNAWLDNNTYTFKDGGKLIPSYYKNYLEKN